MRRTDSVEQPVDLFITNDDILPTPEEYLMIGRRILYNDEYLDDFTSCSYRNEKGELYVAALDPDTLQVKYQARVYEPVIYITFFKRYVSVVYSMEQSMRSWNLPKEIEYKKFDENMRIADISSYSDCGTARGMHVIADPETDIMICSTCRGLTYGKIRNKKRELYQYFVVSDHEGTLRTSLENHRFWRKMEIEDDNFCLLKNILNAGIDNLLLSHQDEDYVYTSKSPEYLDQLF